MTVRGTVTSSWGVPLVGFNVYRVEDGTGEITVVSTEQARARPRRRVEVKGKVEDVAVLADGRSACTFASNASIPLTSDRNYDLPQGRAGHHPRPPDPFFR